MRSEYPRSVRFQVSTRMQLESMNAHALRQRALDIKEAMGLALMMPRQRETLCESSPRIALHFEVMEGGIAYQIKRIRYFRCRSSV